VEKGGEVLYVSDFSDNADGWTPEGGRRGGRSSWTVEEGAYRQNRTGFGMSYFGDENWSDYTLTLKARKLSGNEGFLIVFGRRGGDRLWWNLGGWNNAQHAIELNQTPVGRPAPGRIESDRWYDIKIELAGNRIRCYLDGELIHDVTATPPETFFVNAGRDAARGELVVKAINTAAEPVSAALRLHGFDEIAQEAALTVLSSEQLSDNNSLERPKLVHPMDSQIGNAAAQFGHEFPPHSLSILRIRSSKPE
jgi:alpha-L-arabinofuranosidase